MENFADVKIVVTWEVCDGYAGKARPQKTTVIPSLEFSKDEWEGMSEEEKKDFITEAVQEDFNNKITPEIDDFGI